MKPVIRQTHPFRWDDVDLLPYKPEGTHFRDISRQVLFGGDAGLGCELRYFEIDAAGHSTLERHEHPHAVMVVRGAGRVLVGGEVYDVVPHELVRIAPWTWHQFRASDSESLGFLCLVTVERDRPARPTPAELEEIRSDPDVARFIRT